MTNKHLNFITNWCEFFEGDASAICDMQRSDRKFMAAIATESAQCYP